MLVGLADRRAREVAAVGHAGGAYSDDVLEHGHLAGPALPAAAAGVVDPDRHRDTGRRRVVVAGAAHFERLDVAGGAAAVHDAAPDADIGALGKTSTGVTVTCIERSPLR